MFDALKKLISRTAPRDSQDASFSADEKQLAEAALMFHIIAVDGIVTKDERKRLADVLSEHFGLSGTEVDRLILEAKHADSEAIDLYGFTRILKHALDHEERLTLIAHLWEMVFADGEVNEFEDNIVWRVAELLDISTRDRMELKRRIERKQQADF